MPATELGFIEECEAWKLESRLFPSKVGGKPAWLSLHPLPCLEDLKCKLCEKIMIFLCQIYAPYEDCEEGSEIWENNFHRMIYVFICRNGSCNKRNSSDNIAVFRSTLPRQNDFYSFNPPEDRPDPSFDISKWCSLCHACGAIAEKRCSKCRHVFYCSREHQIIDWKNGHKNNCLKESSVLENLSKILFPEFQVVTETEFIEEEVIDEQKELENFEVMKAKGEAGTLQDIDESDLNLHANSKTDKTFFKFKKQIGHYPDQIIRYSRGGRPLFISNENIPESIPNCKQCSGPRQFEFQIMPQILSKLKENNLDFGILLIYTCKNSCTGNSKNSYKKEFVFKQDVSLSNSIDTE